MIPDGTPSAEGLLEKTPFAHLLVYALDRQLTGELFLEEPGGTKHVLRLDRGVPVKLRVSDDFMRLGDLLVEEGHCARESVEGAAITGGLLGDLLVLTGCVEVEALERCLVRQFRARIARVFTLGPDTSFKYFDKSTVLAEWGGEPSAEDPIALLWEGLRDHAASSSSYEPTLARLGERPLVLHPRAPTSRLKLAEAEALIVDSLVEPTPLATVIERSTIAPDVCKALIYALVILRQLDLGGAGAPVGVRDARPASLAKVQLRSEAHRVGAAVDAKSSATTSRRITVSGRMVIPRDDVPPSVHPPPVEESPVSDLLASPPSLSTEAFDASDVGVIETTEEEIDAALLEEDEDGADAAQAAAVDEPVAPAERIVPEAEPPSETPAAASEGEQATAAQGQAAEPPDAEVESESSRRIVPEALRALEPSVLRTMAEEKLAGKEPSLALQACEAALTKLRSGEGDAGPEGTLFHEITALAAAARAQEPQANLKALTIELDELIRARDDVALTRAVRGRVRRRLGDSPGATSDYRRVLELVSAGSALETEAKRELVELEPKSPGRGQTGFLKRLFKR